MFTALLKKKILNKNANEIFLKLIINLSSLNTFTPVKLNAEYHCVKEPQYF